MGRIGAAESLYGAPGATLGRAPIRSPDQRIATMTPTRSGAPMFFRWACPAHQPKCPAARFGRYGLTFYQIRASHL